MAKSWIEKREINKESKVKINPKKFADIPMGTKIIKYGNKHAKELATKARRRAVKENRIQ